LSIGQSVQNITTYCFQVAREHSYVLSYIPLGSCGGDRGEGILYHIMEEEDGVLFLYY